MQFSSSKYLENARLKALITGKNDLTNFFSNFTEQQIHDRKEREQQLKDYEKAVAQELVCEKKIGWSQALLKLFRVLRDLNF